MNGLIPIGSSSGGGTSDHQALQNLQGGNETERFHMSQSQHQRVLDLIYINLTASFNRTPATFERGVSTVPNLSWAITPNDDVITSRSINNGIGTLSTNSGNVNAAPIVVTTAYQLTVGFTRNGNPLTQNVSVTVTALVPQWRGVSVQEDFTTYAQLNANLTKQVISGTNLGGTFSPTNQYLWFVSTKENPVILDGALAVSIGAWGDPTTGFWKKPLVLTLADGVTTSTVWLFRSRVLINRTNANYSFS